MIELATKVNFPVKQEPFTRFDIFTADEVFLTGTAAEIIPVIELDKRPIGEGKPGPVTRSLITAFRERTLIDGHQVYPDG